MLETLVALVILSLGIAGVLQAFSASLISTKESEMYSRASMLANQVASQLDREETVETGQYSGTFEDEIGYRWEANIEAADANGLMRTEIVIIWGTEARPRHFSMIVCLDSQNSQNSEQNRDSIPPALGG